MFSHKKTKEEAIELWNTRASDEKLEKCLEFIKWINSESKKMGNLFNLVNMSLEDQVCTKSTALDNITMRAEGLLMVLGELDDTFRFRESTCG